MSDDDSIDYSPPHEIAQLQVQVQTPDSQTLDSKDTSISNADTITDSSLDSSSIEVLQPNTGLQIQLPINPPLRQPPGLPESPRTNVAVSHNDSLITEDEDTGDQVVPPAVGAQAAEQDQGRQETLSPRPQNTQMILSAIELTVNDLDTSKHGLTDKCGEIDFQLSNHPDWSKPNYRLCTDLCEIIPILYHFGFNTDRFPNLEKYLYETVGTLPYQSLLHITLDSVFEKFPEISAIQTKVYRMLKCHLSIINHTSVMQFDDITLSNHDFDRVAGTELHSISGAESRPDLSLQTDLNETYYSVFSQAQRQMYRVTERSLNRIQRARANSCPDLIAQVNTEPEDKVDIGWKHRTVCEYITPTPKKFRPNQGTQTVVAASLQVKDMGMQYSSPLGSSDSDSSDSDDNIEGIENITVEKRYLNRHLLSSKDLYTAPTRPPKRFRTSTLEPYERKPEKETTCCPLQEIINHNGLLQIPPVDIIVAPGRRATNTQRGLQRIQAMAGRGRQQNPIPNLQGADLALAEILQLMQNRDANRDNSRKQFLMFPKESFTGQDKKLAKSHWAEFSKYLDYQNQQGTIPRDQQHLPEIISMFKLTLQDIALGWFETESPNWQTEDQVKQEFLKRFNPWGDTRQQQQDAWNKLKFDMAKDNVDAFVVDMKMLARILWHNDEMIIEKFKDIFPDPNIEAALIAMDDFAAMQRKAKQLVQIYKPAHSTNVASTAILVHTPNDSPEKGKNPHHKSNQHQLAPINLPHEEHNRTAGEFGNGQRGQGRGNDRSSRGQGGFGNSENRYNNQDRGGGRGQGRREFNDNRGRGQDNFSWGRCKPWENNDFGNRDRDNRDRNNDGHNNGSRGRRWEGNRGQGNSDQGWGRRWNQNPQYPQQEYSQNYLTQNHYWPPSMGHQYQYQMPYEQYPPYPQPPQQYTQRPPAQS